MLPWFFPWPDAPNRSVHLPGLRRKLGLVKITDDFMVRLLADPRTAPFEKADRPGSAQLVDQICAVRRPCTTAAPQWGRCTRGSAFGRGGFQRVGGGFGSRPWTRRGSLAPRTNCWPSWPLMHREIITDAERPAAGNRPEGVRAAYALSPVASGRAKRAGHGCRLRQLDQLLMILG